MNWEGFLKTWEKPSLFLFGFVLINSYIPALIGASIPTGWVTLIIGVPILLCFYETRITINHILGVLFLLYAALSLYWTINFNIGFFILLKIFALAGVFCLGSSLEFKIKPVIIGMTIGLIVSDIIGYYQHYYNYEGVYRVIGNTAGLFVNKNIFCEISAILFVILLVYKIWWLIPFTLPGIMLVHSRGAILGLTIGFLFWVYNQNKIAGYVSSIVVILGGIIYTTTNSSAISIFERFDLWADTFRGFKFFGNGVGSFEILYPYYATHIDTALARPRFAHNDLLQLFFEFGIVGIIPLLIIVNTLKVKSNDKSILYCIGTISMFSYPMHIPVSSFLAFLFAGYLTRYNDTIRINSFYSRSNLHRSFKEPKHKLLKIIS